MVMMARLATGKPSESRSDSFPQPGPLALGRRKFSNRSKRVLSIVTGLSAVLGIVATTVHAVEPQYAIKHTPYLQLGDAALGSPADQIDLMWQTVPAGLGTRDAFSVEYRRAGDTTWNSTSSITSLDTGVGGRINYAATVPGLAYDTDYQYRMTHLRDGVPVNVYQETFHTRLPAGDPTSFTFASYGDSAYLKTIGNFRAVQSRINQVDAEQGVAFSVVLGDNAYVAGTHAQYDARLDPTINPPLTQYMARHVEYLAIGNHDEVTEGGRPFEENYSFPRTGPATGERSDHNYSFDYGDVHFATFDSNSLLSASRLDNQLDWLVDDMQASDARWKIVFVHHPIAGSPDKAQQPGDNYYQQVVSRLREAGVDLLLAGHSHLYHWTYPLLGEKDGEATFVLDPDKQYVQGAGLVQAVVGIGGRSLRVGDFSPFPFDAAGYSTTTDSPVEYGFAQVDVTQDNLTVRYIAADDGAELNAFSIVHREGPVITGDMNDDGQIDFDDIRPFVLALGDPRAYEALIGLSAVTHGDTNEDGDFDFDDIAGLVNLLEGEVTAVPEPASWILAVIGATWCCVVAPWDDKEAWRRGNGW